uniref:4-hydroxyphenylpyruvate dioxygenase n=1 Tax=Percolomonas cosmopolitus TaxID=63605 RepID=A0A7S1KMG9_9EUKA|eukprot:CAMPEP_0117443012 /NCGR_PEP_ID=MMETSP0759-20121206/4465_1 /TAXON_ID=63605 /ORGANISM="Percolomonas cosmopolitus, Strain WS" /LENGTH=432 /DNA_ID=CAMNT_0005234953 /DNA_START=75 /DNA_END=1373 /DNA_ORIENTATION=-
MSQQNIPDFTSHVSDAKFVGASNFKRQKTNDTPKIQVKRFHHLEFYTGDATSEMKRFSIGLGMKLMAKSDHETGNHEYISYVLQSNDLMFVMTSPYSENAPRPKTMTQPNPSFSNSHAHDFFRKHGLAVKAIGLLVDDAAQAYQYAIENGGIPVTKPVVCGEGDDQVIFSEISAYLAGDVVLRFISFANKDNEGKFLPGYLDLSAETPNINYGLRRIDHCVGNAEKAMPVYAYLNRVMGFYKFAEFIAEDVGTKESGLNSVVCSNHNEMVLLPLNEPTYGTKKISQIQNYLEHNEGPGVQHLALLSDDIYETVRKMKETWAGFDFQRQPHADYYSKIVPKKMGDKISQEEVEKCKELAILIDTEGEGTLLQIFTQPLGDRPTIFIEIIQRQGCPLPQGGQAAGCGGFGKGNFGSLFKSIEDYMADKGLSSRE